MCRKKKSGMSHNKNAKTYKTTGRYLPPTSSTSQPQQYVKLNWSEIKLVCFFIYGIYIGLVTGYL